MTIPAPLRARVIHLACDHAGFAHKEAVRAWLCSLGLSVVDHGAYAYNPDDDFPDFISPAAAAVAKSPETNCALMFGGSGQGEAMVANRFAHVRATVYYGGPDDILLLSREHNDANVLSIGARFVSVDDTKRVAWIWLTTEPARATKYDRRNQKVEAITRTLRRLA